jgi:hypothetical protein
MTFLTAQDQHKLNIITNFGKSKLTPSELIIQSIQQYHADKLTLSDQAIENAYFDINVTISHNLGHNPELAIAARMAMDSPVALERLLERYPSVKHYELITTPKHKGFLGMALGPYTPYTTQLCVNFLKYLYVLVDSLPANKSNTFVATHGIPASYSRIRELAIANKVPALLGITIPASSQHQVFQLFSTAYVGIPELIEEFSLATEPKLLEFYAAHKERSGSDRIFNLFTVRDCPHCYGTKYLEVVMQDRYYSFYLSNRMF